MKGIRAKSLAGLALASGIAASGCSNVQKCVDPCWPQRYNAVARQEVISAFAPQVQNGHILDQTVYNYQFEPGTDRLNASGMDQLDTLLRRRPMPDPRIFLATSRDLSYDPGNPEAMVDSRRELDNKRAAAIQKYVAAQMSGRPMQIEVVVHDPMPVGEAADPVNRSIRLNQNSTTGSLLRGATATTASSTGASGMGGSNGGAGTYGTPQGGGYGGGAVGGGGYGQPGNTPR